MKIVARRPPGAATHARLRDRQREDVGVPVAGKRLLILRKDTMRDSDKADVALLRVRIEEEEL